MTVLLRLHPLAKLIANPPTTKDENVSDALSG